VFSRRPESGMIERPLRGYQETSGQDPVLRRLRV